MRTLKSQLILRKKPEGGVKADLTLVLPMVNVPIQPGMVSLHFPDAMANKKTVLKVRCFKEACLRGLKGGGLVN